MLFLAAKTTLTRVAADVMMERLKHVSMQKKKWWSVCSYYTYLANEYMSESNEVVQAVDRQATSKTPIRALLLTRSQNFMW